jgi:chromosome segregation ATPase
MSVVKRVLMIVLPLILGLGIGFGYGQLQLKKQEKAHQAKIKEMNQRLSQAMRRFSEEKTLQAGLEDEKREVQAQVEELQKEKERLDSRNRELGAKTASLEAKASSCEAKAASLEKKAVSLEAKAASLEAGTASLEKKNSELAAHLSRTEAERDSLDQKLQETVQEVQVRNLALEKAAADWQKSQGDLKRMTQKFERCAGNNAQLSAIASDLVKKYQGKGVMDSILKKEPLTQLQRVELEKLVQEYRDKIEEQKIREK